MLALSQPKSRKVSNMANSNDFFEPMQVDLAGEDSEGDSKMEEETQNIVVSDEHAVDLETVTNSHAGLGRIFRLIFIADSCPPLKEEALNLAMTYLKDTYFVSLYTSCYYKLVNSDPELAKKYPLDNNWIDLRTKQSNVSLEKLDCELKGYKTNSIKESVRRGHDEMGEHYMSSGDFSNAYRCFTRARDYCTNGNQIIQMCFNVIKVSIYAYNWPNVSAFVLKAEAIPELTEDKESNHSYVTAFKCALGLQDLMHRRYRSAANYFLQANFEDFDFREVMAPNNVATYGSLCALASFNRQELRQNVISNNSFKFFLELEPQVREILFKFYEAKYSASLQLLDDLKNTLLLDVYLSNHVNGLYAQIRKRAFVQYFIPYSSMDMRVMAADLNTPLDCLENEIADLISSGNIEANIVSHKKLLKRKPDSGRAAVYEKVMRAADYFGKNYAMFLARSNMSHQSLSVHPTKEVTANPMVPSLPKRNGNQHPMRPPADSQHTRRGRMESDVSRRKFGKGSKVSNSQ